MTTYQSIYNVLNFMVETQLRAKRLAWQEKNTKSKIDMLLSWLVELS